VAGYVEGLKDAHRLLEVGDMALAGSKPIMIWKVGKSEAGQRAAISHTANLGGATALYEAAFRQRGILEVDDVQDLADFSTAFLYGKEPHGRRLAVVTLSGGAGVVMADLCAKFGIEMPRLSSTAEERLREVLPVFGSVLNPVDVTGNLFNDFEMLHKVLRIIIEDASIDSLVVIAALVHGKMAVRLASEIVELDRITEKPILMCWSARDELAKDAYAIIDAARIPRYNTPVRAGRSLNALTAFAEARQQYYARNRTTVRSITRPQARRMLADSDELLTEHRAKQVLAQYGIAVTREQIARARDEALSIATEIGFPVVLKVSSVDIPHKTEAQALRIGLHDAEEVASAYDEIIANAHSFKPGARIDGVLVQEMVTGGVETIAGVANDPRFGPAIMFGLGGILAEALRDVTFRLCPVNLDEAMQMITETRGCAVFTGARGTIEADVYALADALARLSALALDLQDCLAELDINPLIVRPRSRGVIAVDALIRPISYVIHPSQAMSTHSQSSEPFRDKR
jgi:acyl-CoA synthetase (NDP forming)